jgi:hypothetical protein
MLSFRKLSTPPLTGKISLRIQHNYAKSVGGARRRWGQDSTIPASEEHTMKFVVPNMFSIICVMQLIFATICGKMKES